MCIQQYEKCICIYHIFKLKLLSELIYFCGISLIFSNPAPPKYRIHFVIGMSRKFLKLSSAVISSPLLQLVGILEHKQNHFKTIAHTIHVE